MSPRFFSLFKPTTAVLTGVSVNPVGDNMCPNLICNVVSPVLISPWPCVKHLVQSIVLSFGCKHFQNSNNQKKKKRVSHDIERK